MKKEHPHCLYFGSVIHARIAPFRHRFEYRVFSVLLDIDRLQDLPKASRLFSYNKFNLFGFHDKDHGSGEASKLRPWIEASLRRAGVVDSPMAIKLLCYPRILGYVFNPLSVYYCCDHDDQLIALVYEVSNTFGERHLYVARAEVSTGSDKVEPHTTEKVFYVSPFFEVKGEYLFRAKSPGKRVSLQIELSEQGQPLLFTAFSGSYKNLTTNSLLKAFVKYPLMTFKVVGAIHWQALRLWLKGGTYVPKPKKGEVKAPLYSLSTTERRSAVPSSEH